MNRTITITIVVLILLAAAAFGVGYYFYTHTYVPKPSSGGTQTPNEEPVVTGQNRLSTLAVINAFKTEIATYSTTDNAKPGETVISGNFALVSWVGDHTGGEALLKYDAGGDSWSVITTGGGEWSLKGLLEEGVPEQDAQVLLKGMGR
ncbi:hypothetical protein KW798_02560 [Candidatus Parcubacteria bacterium]|nr:hypothetical protein [Candidatus Parcubacteria bacterium]